MRSRYSGRERMCASSARKMRRTPTGLSPRVKKPSISSCVTGAPDRRTRSSKVDFVIVPSRWQCSSALGKREKNSVQASGRGRVKGESGTNPGLVARMAQKPPLNRNGPKHSKVREEEK